MTKSYLFLIMMSSFIAFGRQTPPKDSVSGQVSAINPVKPTGSLRVIVKNFHNDTGKTNVIMYNDPYTFPDKPDRSFKTIWSSISKGYAEVTFENVPYGDYALAAYHDENDNHRLDLSIIGIPKEGTAISNDAKGLFLPRWKDARVYINSPTKTIVMNIGY